MDCARHDAAGNFLCNGVREWAPKASASMTLSASRRGQQANGAAQTIRSASPQDLRKFLAEVNDWDRDRLPEEHEEEGILE
jgi:hypothetical protein